jgi:hypothetical protein
MWERAANRFDAAAEANLPVRSSVHDCGSRTVVLITPPHAEHPTEAHFIAVVLDRQDPDYMRYIVLEHSRDIGGGPRTVLGEWARVEAGVSHVNYGDGPQPDADAFLAVVCEKFTAL